MALSSMQLFLGQVQSAPEELKIRVLQVIFDLLFLYDHDFFGRSDDAVRLYVSDHFPIISLIRSPLTGQEDCQLLTSNP